MLILKLNMVFTCIVIRVRIFMPKCMFIVVGTFMRMVLLRVQVLPVPLLLHIFLFPNPRLPSPLPFPFPSTSRACSSCSCSCSSSSYISLSLSLSLDLHDDDKYRDFFCCPRQCKHEICKVRSRYVYPSDLVGRRECTELNAQAQPDVRTGT